MGYTCLKILGKDPTPGATRAHGKSFKLDLKGEGHEIGLARNKPEGSTAVFEGWCASKEQKED